MKTKVVRIISLIFLISIFILIFIFSNQDGKQSSKLSQIVTTNVESNAGFIKIDFSELEHIIRKIAHFSIYALAGVFAMIFISTYNMKTRYAMILSILIICTYAMTDEFHQSFIPARSPELKDVCIDTLGGTCGAFIIAIIISIYYKIKNKVKN